MANVKAETVIADITDAIEETVTETPKKKTASKKKPAAPREETVDVTKPEPIMFMGFEMKEGADTARADAALKAAADACDAINRKDADLLGSYLALGEAAAEIAPMFKSSKLYGQALAKLAPASSALDPALRSNCKWLFTALNHEDAEGSDLLSVLGVNRLEDFKSANPTVIKREYKNAVKKAAKAEALGVSADDEEALAAAERAAKEAAEAEAIAESKKSYAALSRAMNDYGEALRAEETPDYELLLNDLNAFLVSALSGEGIEAVTEDIKVAITMRNW